MFHLAVVAGWSKWFAAFDMSTVFMLLKLSRNLQKRLWFGMRVFFHKILLSVRLIWTKSAADSFGLIVSLPCSATWRVLRREPNCSSLRMDSLVLRHLWVFWGNWSVMVRLGLTGKKCDSWAVSMERITQFLWWSVGDVLCLSREIAVFGLNSFLPV